LVIPAGNDLYFIVISSSCCVVSPGAFLNILFTGPKELNRDDESSFVW